MITEVETQESPKATIHEVRGMMSFVKLESLAAVLDEGQSDLKEQALNVASLKQQAQQLLSDTEGRIRDCEFNGHELRRRRDHECERLRCEYDDCISKGDRDGADEKLKRIREARLELENIAKIVTDSDGESEDLKERQEQVNAEAHRLYHLTLHLAKFAEALHSTACQVMATASTSAASHLRKLDGVIEQSQKDSKSILAE